MSEESHQIAVHIAEKLREAGICEIFNFVRTKPGVLRRDRNIVALSLLTALAWSYLLWLSADMKMDGMDMDGFRMIPSGMGLMVPAGAPWRAMEFVFVFAMWTVMTVGMMTPWAAPMILMYARVGRQTEAQRPLVATVWLVSAISLHGSLSRCSPPCCSGHSSVLVCSIPRWRAPALSSEGSCS